MKFLSLGVFASPVLIPWLLAEGDATEAAAESSPVPQLAVAVTFL